MDVSFRTLQDNIVFRIVLLPLTLLYAAGVFIRNLAYNLGILKIRRLPLPVISIGNISAGGSGKTPLTMYVAELLSGLGVRPAIISRGYKRTTKGTVVVSDDVQIRVPVTEAGDEPYMMASRLKNVPVVVSESRYEGGKAVSGFNPEVLILDDGFQHRKLHKDLNIVIMNDDSAGGYLRLLPSGYQREPAASLKRADIIICNNCSERTKQAVGRECSGMPVFDITYVVSGAFDKSGGKRQGLAGTKAAIFAGIADFPRFAKTCRDAGIIVAGETVFGDHHAYTKADIEKIEKRWQSVQGEMILTTEKDYYKVISQFPKEIPLYYLKADISMEPGAEDFRKIILGSLKKRAG